MEKKVILVTGGAGYIGSHTVVALEKAGYRAVILDNLSNSNVKVLDRLKLLGATPLKFLHGDVRDKDLLDWLFSKHPVHAVIHFAALKAVHESIEWPTRYLENNVGGMLTLLDSMDRAGVRRIVFSSSATVYGEPEIVPISETAPLSAVNPYGRTKLICEDALRQIFAVNSNWHIAILRYFNPIGAHASGLLGEAPSGIPNNLMPYITQVATRQRQHLEIFGNDYDTPDGTCIRDYLHVVDLAEGHIAALSSIEYPGLITVNLGTGRGVSVNEIVRSFERVNGISIPVRFVSRRAGDVVRCYAETELAKILLKWQACRSIEQACKDSWNWQVRNPDGFDSPAFID
jgi:UDP-glucose 4-epimerase